jgi:hypothetical protein
VNRTVEGRWRINETNLVKMKYFGEAKFGETKGDFRIDRLVIAIIKRVKD